MSMKVRELLLHQDDECSCGCGHDHDHEAVSYTHLDVYKRQESSMLTMQSASVEL